MRMETAVKNGQPVVTPFVAELTIFHEGVAYFTTELVPVLKPEEYSRGFWMQCDNNGVAKGTQDVMTGLLVPKKEHAKTVMLDIKRMLDQSNIPSYSNHVNRQKNKFAHKFANEAITHSGLAMSASGEVVLDDTEIERLCRKAASDGVEWK